MTNVHKFVTVKREEKSGGSNRIGIDKDMEFQTLKAELKVLNPTIVVFQEPSTGNLDAKQIADLKRTLNGCSIIKLQHPIYSQEGWLPRFLAFSGKYNPLIKSALQIDLYRGLPTHCSTDKGVSLP